MTFRRYPFHRLIAGLFLLPVIITATIADSAVYAVPDIIFYSTNEITHYDPTACANTAGGDSSGSAADVDEGANVETVLKFLTGKGLTLAQATGIAGNMKQESHFDPKIIQGGATAPDNYVLVKDVGFGLVQWTSRGRQVGLMDYAKETNRKITDMTMQLDYVWKELMGPYKSTLQKLVKTTNPVDAAIIVEDGYEISDDDAAKVREKRGGAAQGYYDKYKGKIADGTGVGGVDGATTPTTAGGGACGAGASATEFSDDGFVVYNQCDPRWADVAYGTNGKTSCTSGCGPTAMAAAITALTGKAVTPKETVAYASSKGMYVNGSGSSHVLPTVIGDHWGVNAKPLDASISAINKVLSAGGLVIMAGTSEADPFTGAGHYILIRGLTNGKWKIADSNFQGNGEANSKKEWDPKPIMDVASRNASSIYSITK